MTDEDLDFAADVIVNLPRILTARLEFVGQHRLIGRLLASRLAPFDVAMHKFARWWKVSFGFFLRDP